MDTSRVMTILRVAAAVGLVFFGPLTWWAISDYTTCISLDCAGAAIGMLLFGGLAAGCAVLVVAWVVEVLRRHRSR